MGRNGLGHCWLKPGLEDGLRVRGVLSNIVKSLFPDVFPRWSSLRVRRRYLAIPVFLVMLTAILIVHFNAGTQATSRIVASSPSPSCRSGNSLPQLNPMRVRLLSKCQVASGVVESFSPQYDGDQRIDVALDAQYTKLLNAGNMEYQNGSIVLELTPQDQATISVPTVGQHITFVGSLVYDTENHWNAVYPVWLIQEDYMVSPS